MALELLEKVADELRSGGRRLGGDVCRTVVEAVQGIPSHALLPQRAGTSTGLAPRSQLRKHLGDVVRVLAAERRPFAARVDDVIALEQIADLVATPRGFIDTVLREMAARPDEVRQLAVLPQLVRSILRLQPNLDPEEASALVEKAV